MSISLEALLIQISELTVPFLDIDTLDNFIFSIFWNKIFFVSSTYMHNCNFKLAYDKLLDLRTSLVSSNFNASLFRRIEMLYS